MLINNWTTEVAAPVYNTKFSKTIDLSYLM